MPTKREKKILDIIAAKEELSLKATTTPISDIEAMNIMSNRFLNKTEQKKEGIYYSIKLKDNCFIELQKNGKAEFFTKKEVMDCFTQYSPIFKDAKSALSNNILKQIKDLTFRKVILIMGDDARLVTASIVCIYLIHMRFYSHVKYSKQIEGGNGEWTPSRVYYREQSYVGWEKAVIESHLFSSQIPMIGHFENGNVLSLRGINDENIMKRLIDTARECFYRNGLLIINTDKADIISQGFLDKTEKIYLKLTISFKDTTKTITICEKEYPAIPDRKYKLFKLLYENKERLVSKREIMQHLVTGGTGEESQVFKLITSLRTTFSECRIEITKVSETKNQSGGYQMII